MNKLLQGVVVPVPTPLDCDENIDLKGLARLVDFMVQNAVDGIFILGTMGEFASITDKQKIVMVEKTVKEARGRIKVFCGVGDCGTKRVIENASVMQNYKIDAIVPLLPFYYPQRREGESVKFLEEFLNNVEIPVIFYENPIMTRRKLTKEEFQWLKQQKKCMGVKDSSGQLDKFKDIVEIFADRDEAGVLTGTGEQTLECMQAGGHGIVPGLGALVPDLCVKMCRSAIKQDWEECRRLQDKYIRITKIYSNNKEYWPAAQKTALRFLNIMDDYVTSPHFKLNDEETDFVRQILLEEGVL